MMRSRRRSRRCCALQGISRKTDGTSLDTLTKAPISALSGMARVLRRGGSGAANDILPRASSSKTAFTPLSPAHRREPRPLHRYFEITLRGSRRRGARSRPALPPSGGAGALRRAEIEDGALAGQGLELLWVDDPVDAFFLEIQGSGRVHLKEGGTTRNRL